VCEPPLAHVVVRTGLSDLEDALLVVVPAHGDDRQLGIARTHASRGLHTVELRHLDVHDDGVGIDLFRELNRLLSIARPAGQGEPLVLLEDERDCVEERIVILGDKDPERSWQRFTSSLR
jgi:hypothetical protein